MANKTVTILSNCLVGPKQPSTSSPARFRLTVFDLIMSHCPFQKRIIFYRSSHSPSLLQQSLSEILVHFYPLAGRIHPLQGFQAELICSNEGVYFSEASTDANIDDLVDFRPSFFTDQLIQTGDFRATLPWKPETPLLCIQLTKFACGGTSLGFAYSHQMADGPSVWQFLKSWAEITVGKSLSFHPLVTYGYVGSESSISSPQEFGFRFGGSEKPPHETKDSDTVVVKCFNFDKEKMTKDSDTVVVKCFNFDKEKINSLKCSLNSSYTSFEVITAHIWKKITEARSLPSSTNTSVAMLINCRKRLPSLPVAYFGNACLAAVVHTDVTGIDSKGLDAAAELVHKALENSTAEHLQGLANYFEDVFNGKAPAPGFEFENSLLIAGSQRHPLYEVDFGFGKPLGCSYGMDDWQDGKVYLLPGNGGEGIHATISLFSQTMQRLNEDSYFC